MQVFGDAGAEDGRRAVFGNVVVEQQTGVMSVQRKDVVQVCEKVVRPVQVRVEFDDRVERVEWERCDKRGGFEVVYVERP